MEGHLAARRHDLRVERGGKTLLRASFSRNAGQLTAVGTYIGYANPSSAAGWVEYPWVDANGDHLAQTNEVQVNQPLLASGNGFNTSNPTSVTSANRIDPDFGPRPAWASSSASIAS